MRCSRHHSLKLWLIKTKAWVPGCPKLGWWLWWLRLIMAGLRLGPQSQACTTLPVVVLFYRSKILLQIVCFCSEFCSKLFSWQYCQWRTLQSAKLCKMVPPQEWLLNTLSFLSVTFFLAGRQMWQDNQIFGRVDERSRAMCGAQSKLVWASKPGSTIWGYVPALIFFRTFDRHFPDASF